MTAVAKRRLPILQTVRRAVELLWIHRAVQLRVAMPCLIVLSVAISLFIHKMASVPPEKLMEMLEAMPKKYMLVWMCFTSVGMILLLMFSVVWRRFLLLEAPPTTLIFNQAFRRYLIVFMIAYFSVFFAGAVFGNMLIALFTTNVNDQITAVSIGAMCLLISFGVMTLIVTRFVLMFTAAATGAFDLKLRDAAAYMKGNVLRYAAAWIILFLAVNFVSSFIGLILSIVGIDPATAIGAIAIGIFNSFTMVITISLTASLAALSYDFLVSGRGPESAQTVAQF